MPPEKGLLSINLLVQMRTTPADVQQQCDLCNTIYRLGSDKQGIANAVETALNVWNRVKTDVDAVGGRGRCALRHRLGVRVAAARTLVCRRMPPQTALHPLVPLF